jgi:hypothetical protein
MIIALVIITALSLLVSVPIKEDIDTSMLRTRHDYDEFDYAVVTIAWSLWTVVQVFSGIVLLFTLLMYIIP